MTGAATSQAISTIKRSEKIRNLPVVFFLLAGKTSMISGSLSLSEVSSSQVLFDDEALGALALAAALAAARISSGNSKQTLWSLSHFRHCREPSGTRQMKTFFLNLNRHLSQPGFTCKKIVDRQLKRSEKNGELT